MSHTAGRCSRPTPPGTPRPGAGAISGGSHSRLGHGGVPSGAGCAVRPARQARAVPANSIDPAARDRPKVVDVAGGSAGLDCLATGQHQ